MVTIRAMEAARLMVIVNDHIVEPGWCCSENDGKGLWYSGSVTE